MTTEDQDQDKIQNSQEVEEDKPAPRKRTRRASGAAKEEQGKKPAAKRTRRTTAKAKPSKELEESKEVTIKSIPSLLEKLRSEVGPAMTEEFGYTSSMQIPRLTKVILNIGLGETLTNSRALEAATGDLTLISGQKPVTTRAKKSIAGFKIREGMPIGVSVTLRGTRMYEFMDRLLNSTLPRIRDFQGVSRKAFDGRGNFSLGIREQVIFPEIDYNNIDRIRGLQIVVVTTASNDVEGMRMLELLGMPFTRNEESKQVA